MEKMKDEERGSMSIGSEINSAIGLKTRRVFLQAMGAAGMALVSRSAWSAALPASVRGSLARAGKKVTLLNDGGFTGSAWGWQFTAGAKVTEESRRAGRRCVLIDAESGEYARFLVLGPEGGKTYTLSGWVKTLNVAEQEENAGAYFAASQFEFQGRPTEFTVDGKQLPEQRCGNFTGTSEWRKFSQTFHCAETTTWFEVVVGIYRASGKAWFSDLTFVEGDQSAELDDVLDVGQAEQWAHEDLLKSSGRTRPAAAILQDVFPVRGAASDPKVLGRILSETHDVEFVSAERLADKGQFNRNNFDLLVLPYGESFPLAAKDAVEAFLANGGDLLTTGGYAFRSPLLKSAGAWEFNENILKHDSAPNLLSDVGATGSAWKLSDPKYASAVTAIVPGVGAQNSAKIEVPRNLWEQDAGWSFDLPASGDGKQFFFQCWIRATDVIPAPNGCAYVGVEQLDSAGELAYAAKTSFEEIRGSSDWHKIEQMFYLVPIARTLRVRIGLKSATGMVLGAGFRLEPRSPQVRINTEFGYPEDSLVISPRQIGMFDADFRIKRAAAIGQAKEQSVLEKIAELPGEFEGYAATAVVGMNNARWIPLLQCTDHCGRNRGAAGALVHHAHGYYARGTWAFFGVDNKDIFAAGSALGETTLRAVGRCMARKCFLHECGTDFSCYRDGEAVQLRVLASNYGRKAISVKLHWEIQAAGSGESVFAIDQQSRIVPGQTLPMEAAWHPASFGSDQYRITVRMSEEGEEIDRMTTGFNVWKQATLRKGLAFEFKDNYFQVNGHSLFLQGTDDYLHTFIDQDENPLTWHEDAQGCRDSCIDVYENLMGLRGPQQRPTEAWWRWIDAMLLNVQRVGGIFFPGMLIFSNTAVSEKDLSDQRAYVRAFAARYKDAPGIMYYLNGDLELHDPNLPDLQKLYNKYLGDKYGSDEALRAAWALSPPEAPIGKLTIRRGAEDWRDVRTLDDFRFRTQVVRRWLNAMHDSIREVDQKHPVTAEFYQTPTSGIDLLLTLDKPELANFGYFNTKEEDYYRFPQTCKFLDQSLRGKGINVGEFGVKTHPAWRDTGEYIEARSEAYEQAYFMAIAHYAFALGASKIQNWCWKYPADLPFEWGINYPNDLVPRDVRAFYRNSGLLFREVRPRFESSEVIVLLAGDNRMGGQGSRIIEGQLNGIRLLLDQRLRFATLADDYLESLPTNVKTIFYPLPYCPSDRIVKQLEEFVDRGGQLYISGDLSYDSLRQRTRTERLKELCGVEFVTERYQNISYDKGAMQTSPGVGAWPKYAASPGIVTRLAGARTLLQGEDGTPIVTEFHRGRGRVIFSADPIELHGDPRYQPYAHAFYGALLDAMHLKGEQIDPRESSVHCFRVPSQDGREIVVLVNHDPEVRAENITVPVDGSQVRLTLQPRMSGAIVAAAGKGVQAVESSGNVFEGSQMLLGTDLHAMAISFDKESLLRSRRLLILPMGEGEICIPNASRWKQPMILAGEISGSRWKETESIRPGGTNGNLTIPIPPYRALSMLIVCEAGDKNAAIEQMETWVNSPWELDDRA
jgi:hypothetical protein